MQRIIVAIVNNGNNSNNDIGPRPPWPWRPWQKFGLPESMQPELLVNLVSYKCTVRGIFAQV